MLRRYLINSTTIFIRRLTINLLLLVPIFDFSPGVWYSHWSQPKSEFTPESSTLGDEVLPNKDDFVPKVTRTRNLWLRMKEYLSLHHNFFCWSFLVIFTTFILQVVGHVFFLLWQCDIEEWGGQHHQFSIHWYIRKRKFFEFVVLMLLTRKMQRFNNNVTKGVETCNVWIDLDRFHNRKLVNIFFIIWNTRKWLFRKVYICLDHELNSNFKS